MGTKITVEQLQQALKKIVANANTQDELETQEPQVVREAEPQEAQVEQHGQPDADLRDALRKIAASSETEAESSLSGINPAQSVSSLSAAEPCNIVYGGCTVEDGVGINAPVKQLNANGEMSEGWIDVRLLQKLNDGENGSEIPNEDLDEEDLDGRVVYPTLMKEHCEEQVDELAKRHEILNEVRLKLPELSDDAFQLIKDSILDEENYPKPRPKLHINGHPATITSMHTGEEFDVLQGLEDNEPKYTSWDRVEGNRAQTGVQYVDVNLDTNVSLTSFKTLTVVRELDGCEHVIGLTTFGEVLYFQASVR